MNARQKAKIYKRELDILKRQTIKPIITEDRRKVRTFAASHRIVTDGMTVVPDNDVILDHLCSMIAKDKEFQKAVTFIRNPYGVCDRNEMIYRAEIDILCR